MGEMRRPWGILGDTFLTVPKISPDGEALQRILLAWLFPTQRCVLSFWVGENRDLDFWSILHRLSPSHPCPIRDSVVACL